MPTTTSSPQRFQVNLAGVIEVLSRHLYRQGPEVIIRELLQNAADALTARKVIDPAHAGAIDLACDSLGSDSAEWLLTVSDDGIGLERSEVESCLATIGFSHKALEQESPATATPFIGRFGIGLLSCFMVADEIRIVSRSLHPGSEPFRWIGHANGNWEIHPLDHQVAFGTTVFLKVGTRNGVTLKPSNIADLASKFGEYMPWKITVGSSDGSRVVTRVPFWQSAKTPEQLTQLEGEYFKDGCLGAFPFKSPGAEADGVAFIVKDSVMPGGELSHRLYVHRMLVSTRARGLTPAFAPLLRCLVHSTSLRVNAAREDVHGEERRLAVLHEDLAATLRDYLKTLADKQPNLLKKIVLTHHECFLGAAETHDEFIDLLRAVIPLQTTLGETTFDRIFSRHGRVEYIDDERDYQRIEHKAQQEGDCLVRAYYRMPYRLLSLLCQKLGPEHLRRLTASEYLARFGAAGDTLSEEESRLIVLSRKELARESCAVEFEDADDPDAPAILHLNDEESLERLLCSPAEAFDDESGSGGSIPATAQKRLLLNRTHPLIELLLDSRDLPDGLGRAWLRLIFHHALLVARETPTSGENRRHARALTALWKATYTTHL